MPLDPSVSFQAKKAFQSATRLRYNRMLITFVPTGGLVAGFTELSLAVTQGNYKALLRARGGEPTDLVWKACAAYFAPAFAPIGAAKAKFVSDKLILGRRTNAEATKWTVLVTGGVDGTYTLGAAGYEGVATYAAVGKTAAEIRTELITAWNLLVDLAADTTAVTNGAASLDISTDVDGFPLIVTGSSTGSALTITKTTVDGNYATDLNAIRLDNDPNGLGEFWAIHDLQLDDKTNRQGVQWCIAERTADPLKRYVYAGESYQATISDGAVVIDEASTLKALLTPLAEENNDRGVGLFLVQSVDFAVPRWFGRCIGYNLGAINFAQRELIGLPTINLGDDEVIATLKYFNFYSPESPNGNTKWGHLGSGRWIDDLWAEDILTHEGRTGLLELLVNEDALAYTDADGISQGKSAIIQKMLKYTGAGFGYLIADSIEVVAGLAAAQSLTDKIEIRQFVDYQVSALAAPLINRFGSTSNVITFTVSV